MQVSRTALTLFLIHNNASSDAMSVTEIQSTMAEMEDSNTKIHASLSRRLKKAQRQEERSLDEIAEDKVDKKNEKADAGVLILQGQDDGTRCEYLDGSPGVKCVGVDACKGVTIVEIGCGSCLGTRSCEGLAGTTTVAEDSCVGYEACYEAVDTKIGKDSCNDYRACYEAVNTTIAYRACRGYYACYEVTDMTIAIEGCNGYKSCYGAERSTVGMKSCQDKEACYEVKDMIIHNRSCRGYEPCYQAERTTVHGGSCIGERACAYMLDSDVGKFSCIGDNACKFNCINTIIVGNDSCFGTESCYEGSDQCYNYGGYNYGGRQLGPVGSRSCNGSYACNDSYGGSLGSCQCNGVNACQDTDISAFSGLTCSPTSSPIASKSSKAPVKAKATKKIVAPSTFV